MSPVSVKASVVNWRLYFPLFHIYHHIYASWTNSLTTEHVFITPQRQCVIAQQTLLFALGLIQQDKEERICFSFSWLQIRTNTVAMQTNSKCRERVVSLQWKQVVAEVARPAGGWSRLLSVSHSQTAWSRYWTCTCATVIGHNWCSNNATLTSWPSRVEPFLCFSKKKKGRAQS